SPYPRKCISYGCTCSTKSATGSVGPPASSTIVFSPRSVSSLAAQPPLIPEPTTIASNLVVSAIGTSGRLHGRVAVEAPGHDDGVQDVLLHTLAREIAVDHESLEPRPRAGDGRLPVHGLVERVQQRLAGFGRHLRERRRAREPHLRADRVESREEDRAFVVVVVLGDDHVDEGGHSNVSGAWRIRARNDRVRELGDERRALVRNNTRRRTWRSGDGFPGRLRGARHERECGCGAKRAQKIATFHLRP